MAVRDSRRTRKRARLDGVGAWCDGKVVHADKLRDVPAHRGHRRPQAMIALRGVYERHWVVSRGDGGFRRRSAVGQLRSAAAV